MCSASTMLPGQAAAGRGDEYRDEHVLIEQHLALAYWWARRFARPGIGLEDLRQTAAEALVRAAGSFDPDRGTAFSAYAGACIAGSLKRYLRDYSWSIRPPRSLQQHSHLVAIATDELTATLHRSPTPAELADHLDLQVGQVLAAREAAAQCHADSLDRLPSGPDTPRRGDPDIDPAIEKAENLAALQPILASLPDRDRALLSMRFGQEMTQTQIAEQFGISQMQVSRLLSALLVRLRRRPLAEPG